jgi:bacteriorhodopsin
LYLGWLVLLPLLLIQMFWSAANPFESRAEVAKWIFQSFVLVTVIAMLVLSCIIYSNLI